MKNLILKSILLFGWLVLNIIILPAQSIYLPSNTTNCSEMTLSHIEQTNNATTVGFIYMPTSDYEMYINSGMFIENAFKTNAKKYKLKAFYVDGYKRNVDHYYRVNEGDIYFITFEFEALPKYLKNINIKEPSVLENHIQAWCWNGIDLTDNKLVDIAATILYGNNDELLTAVELLTILYKYYPEDESIQSLYLAAYLRD